mmetsp:Transcript_17593/g.36524  ORF Transcript_17593/g.36524 Transcript_17593/m.36524 type:complete len:212 (+) Transcript_17593:1405-2040(+)
MPYLWGHGTIQKKLVGRLDEIYTKVQKANGLAIGDFPDRDQFRKGLEAFDLSEFPKLSQRQLDVMDLGLSRDIPKMMQSMQEGELNSGTDMLSKLAGNGNPFDINPDHSSRDTWIVDATSKANADNLFFKLGASGEPPILNGDQARPTLLESGLPVATLHKIWGLSDIDGDGCLDCDEFALCLYLVKSARISGSEALPDTLHDAYIPPSKR